jgi:hypothetical protein
LAEAFCGLRLRGSTWSIFDCASREIETFAEIFACFEPIWLGPVEGVELFDLVVEHNGIIESFFSLFA